MTDEIKMPDTGREIAPREALLEAITTFDIGKVRAMFSDEALEALSMAIGQEATKEEVRKALVTQDGTTTSLLMTACSIGNYEAAEVLIQQGSPVDAVAPSGNTAVFYAARVGYINVLELLTSKGVDVNAKNVSGDSPLMFCASGASQSLEGSPDNINYAKCIHHLLDLGAVIDDSNKNGLNTLHCAATNFLPLNALFSWFTGKQHLSSALKSAINQKTIIGDSPLHFAAVEGAIKCCQLLLSHGADPLIRSKAGKTPLASTKDSSCISLLKDAESTATEAYHKKQQALLDELASEPHTKTTNSPSNRKSKPSNKLPKVSQATATTSDQKSIKSPSPVKPTNISKAQPPLIPSNHVIAPAAGDKSSEKTLLKTDEKPKQISPSWASVASTKSDIGQKSPNPAIVFAKSVQSSQSVEEMAADTSKKNSGKPTPIVPSEPLIDTYDALDNHLASLHSMAAVLGLNAGHALGLGVSELSMEQLDALETIHQTLVKSINTAKLEVIRKQERAFFEEEMDRRLDTLKRVQSGTF